MVDVGKIPFQFQWVRFINTPHEGIAKSHRATGGLVINLHFWNTLIQAHQFFILAHEEGHIVCNTRDELVADEWASKKYFEAGLPLTESVKALGKHLKNDNKVHIARTWLQYQRALKYDYEHNQNPKTYRPHYDDADSVKQKLQLNAF